MRRKSSTSAAASRSRSATRMGSVCGSGTSPPARMRRFSICRRMPTVSWSARISSASSASSWPKVSWRSSVRLSWRLTRFPVREAMPEANRPNPWRSAASSRCPSTDTATARAKASLMRPTSSRSPLTAGRASGSTVWPRRSRATTSGRVSSATVTVRTCRSCRRRSTDRVVKTTTTTTASSPPALPPMSQATSVCSSAALASPRASTERARSMLSVVICTEKLACAEDQPPTSAGSLMPETMSLCPERTALSMRVLVCQSEEPTTRS